MVELSEDVQPGAVCLPHGWGARRRKLGAGNGLGGPNFSALTLAGPGTIEPLAGMTVLNGVAVRVGPTRAVLAPGELTAAATRPTII